MASLKHDAGPPPCAAGPAEAVPRLPPGPSPDSVPTPQYPLDDSEQIRGPLSRRQFMHVAVQGGCRAVCVRAKLLRSGTEAERRHATDLPRRNHHDGE